MAAARIANNLQSQLFRQLINYHGQIQCKVGFRSTVPSLSNDKKADRKQLETSDGSEASEIIRREFSHHYDSQGKFVSRIGYVEFIDEGLLKIKELGLEKDLEAYKELIKIFPPGKFWPRYKAEFGLFYAPQQLACVRVLHQMDLNGVKPDREVERLVVSAFSKRSDAWLKIARMNYWSMKGRNLDPNPLPEVIPKEPHKLAKLAIMRMLDDQKSVLTVTNTSRLSTAVDRTWLVFSQSPDQKATLDRLNENSTLFIEEGGLAYVGDKYLAYHLLRYYVDDETLNQKSRPPKPDFNFNTMKYKFYGKPVDEKLTALEDANYVDGSYILSIGITGTSSQDSLLSWLKILQERNPKLNKMNVVFKMSRPTPEIVKIDQDLASRSQKASN